MCSVSISEIFCFIFLLFRQLYFFLLTRQKYCFFEIPTRRLIRPLPRLLNFKKFPTLLLMTPSFISNLRVFLQINMFINKEKNEYKAYNKKYSATNVLMLRVAVVWLFFQAPYSMDSADSIAKCYCKYSNILIYTYESTSFIWIFWYILFY